MSEWQPIETAPKGEMLDIWAVEYYGPPEAPSFLGEIEYGSRFTNCEWVGDGLGWIYDNVTKEHCSVVHDRGYMPTHWTRPPAPPSANPDVQ